MEFRPLRRLKQELTDEVILKLLETEKRAVLAVNGDGGYPYAVPVDYYYDNENGRIYFHGAGAGHKYDAISRGNKVCLTIYGREEYRKDDWAPYLQSIVLFGRCRVMNTDEKLPYAKKIGMKYYPTEDDVDRIIEDTMNRLQVFEITIEHICGKQIHEQ